MRVVHLTALWAYAVTQPILSLLHGNPEVLVFRGVGSIDAAVFAVLLAVGPPVLAVGYSRIAALVSDWVGDVLYVVFFSAFLVPIALHVVKLLDRGELTSIVLVVVVTVCGVLVYLRQRVAKLFLGFSIVLPIIAIGSFVLTAPATASAARTNGAHVTRPHPVVLVVLDELPVSSLLDRDGLIDAARFPNFGRLARTATWYPRATTVGAGTEIAVPAILTATMPAAGELPSAADHPLNLFALLQDEYRLNVEEAITQLCASSQCADGRDSFLDRLDKLAIDVGAPYAHRILPRALSSEPRDITVLDGVFQEAIGSRKADYDRFIDGLEGPRSSHTLHFLHLMFPHAPWLYDREGRGLRPRGVDSLVQSGVANPSVLVQLSLQAHLLQVEYTDTLLGGIVDRLEQLGLFDQALVIVVADHGASFRAGVRRRTLGRANFADIAAVPLIVKYPEQRRGAVDQRPARIVDILPTVADVLGFSVPRGVGRSLLGQVVPRKKSVIFRFDGTHMSQSLSSVERRVRSTVRRNVALFGDGRESVYRMGRSRMLLGSEITPAAVVQGSTLVRIDEGDEFANVDASGAVLPTRISGVVERGRVEPGAELAVSVNGRVWALARCFADGKLQRFRALVPSQALRDGHNRVDVFVIRHALARRLLLVGSTDMS
jgi:hypothetical protein